MLSATLSTALTGELLCMTPMQCSKPDTEQEVPVITDVNNSYDFSEG